MAPQKKDSINYIYKKYSPESDIIPVHPTAFSIGVDDNSTVLNLEFAFDNHRNDKHQRIVLGSYMLTEQMTKNLVIMLQERLDEFKKREIKNDSQ